MMAGLVDAILFTGSVAAIVACVVGIVVLATTVTSSTVSSESPQTAQQVPRRSAIDLHGVPECGGER